MSASRPSPDRKPGPLLQQVDRTYVVSDGQKLSYFGGCDYFRLSSHPKVLRALQDGLRNYGLNVSASRFTTGNHAIYQDLEGRLADYFAVESATLTSTGYMANSVVAQALSGQFSHAFVDRESHSSLTDSAQFLGARVIMFKRGKSEDLHRQLRARNARRILVITEGLFSHNGEIAPLREYLAVMPPSAMLLIDDAHGVGVLGKTGKGTVEELDLPTQRVIRTVTLSKAFGVYGGAVLGTRKLQQRIYDTSPTLVGNTPLPPPLAAAALTAVEIMQVDRGLRKRLCANAGRVKSALQDNGIAVGHSSTPIFGVIPRGRAGAATLQERLLKHGIYPSFIRYPGGPRNGFFRFAISSEHRPEQLEALIAALT